MKFSSFVLFSLAKSQDMTNEVRRANQERRYFQLTEMMENYNSEFDERKYWAYGCNCLILGDRPMSDPGHGRPVDELDTVCKAYKDCLKCARWAYGDTCIGEFRKYKFGIRRGEVTCRSKVSFDKGFNLLPNDSISFESPYYFAGWSIFTEVERTIKTDRNRSLDHWLGPLSAG